MNENKISSLDMIEILKYVWKGKFFILALMFLSALLAAIRIEFFVNETYTADGVLYIYSQNINEQPNEAGVTGTEINDARTMSTTYMETLKLRSFLTEVSKETGGVYSWSQIREMMHISSVNDTEYISVSVTAYDPQTAYELAKCICEKAQDKFLDIFKNGEATIVDTVVYPKHADSKGELKAICVGFVMGGVLGSFIIIAVNLLDRKIRKSEEISNRHGISILGETAVSKTEKKRKAKKKRAHSEFGRIIDSSTDFDTVETYKAIRTNIMFSVPKREKGKAIVVTSAAPCEGKTTTSINLALIFAQMGVKVLLIDCDLRKPRVHRYIGLERGAGVSNIICGYADIKDAIHRNVKENLDVITSGDIPPNPTELLENQGFSKMLESLQNEYEYIFVDTPPITVVTDAVVVMKNCTGTILVARQGVTVSDLFDAAVTETKKSNVKILGAIFHDSNEKQSKWAYYRRGKYGYKYKDNYRYGDEIKTKQNRVKRND